MELIFGRYAHHVCFFDRETHDPQETPCMTEWILCHFQGVSYFLLNSNGRYEHNSNIVAQQSFHAFDAN